MVKSVRLNFKNGIGDWKIIKVVRKKDKTMNRNIVINLMGGYSSHYVSGEEKIVNNSVWVSISAI